MSKSQILEAAAQIFREKGFHAASMQDIADAVNLKKASLYHHVSGKQEILLNLLDHAMEVLIERTTEVISNELSPDEKLRCAIQAYMEAIINNSDIATVLLFEYRTLAPKLKKKHNPQRDRFEAIWRAIIEEGIHQNIYTCQDANLATKSLFGIMNWSMMWYRTDGKLSATEIANFCADTMLNGLYKR